MRWTKGRSALALVAVSLFAIAPVVFAALLVVARPWAAPVFLLTLYFIPTLVNAAQATVAFALTGRPVNLAQPRFRIRGVSVGAELSLQGDRPSGGGPDAWSEGDRTDGGS